MARIPILDENDPALEPAVREALLEAGRSRGRLVNVYRALANRPEAMTVLSQLMQTVYRTNSTLEPQHGELAYMTATSVNDCFYWIPTHIALGRGLGLTDEKMRHLTDDPLPEGVYTAPEAAIIRYAQKSTRLEAIDDATYGALEQHFSRQQIIDICLTVGLSNMINRFHATFQTDVDETTLKEIEDGTPEGMSCPIRLPKRPGTK